MGNKVSSCCGAAPIGASEDMQRCPECKESCDYFEYDEDGNPIEDKPEPKEFVKVKIEKFKWEHIVNACYLDSNDFIITDVIIKDDLFNDDATWHTLKQESTKAYKKWQEYEFRTRHNIKK